MGESKLDEVPSHQIYGGAVAPRMVFWPMVPSSSTGAPTDVPFEMVATDLSGRRITFSVPLLFVGKLANQSKHAEIIEAYNDTYYAPFASVERQVRQDLAAGRRHLYEAEMKRQRRIRG